MKKATASDTRQPPMSRHFVKSSGVVFLCMILLYSGVAWALEACLHQDGHADHAASLHSQTRRSDHSISDGLASPDGAPASLHCLDSHDPVGPTLQSSSASRVAPSTRGAVLKAFFSPQSVATSQARDFWLRAPFRRFSSLSFLSRLSLQLVLSVFLI